MPDKLTKGATAVHSHPDSCIFSIEDIMALITNPNLEKIGSIDPQGRTCIMEKPKNFTTIDKNRAFSIYREFCDVLKEHWIKAIGIPQNPKKYASKKTKKI